MKVLNIVQTLNSLRKNSSASDKELIKIKLVYKMKNNMIIDQYHDQYGYWYQVHRGDSLFRISQNTGCPRSLLASVNSLSPKSQLTYKAFLFIPVSEDYLRKNADIINVQVHKDQFIWPVYGRISSGFGLRQWGWRKKFHRGIDVVAPSGAKIICTADGIVHIARREKEYGNMVTIEHENKIQSVYGHMQKILVAEGEEVKQGQLVGLVGKTGHATGYHLHFELRIQDYPVNPCDYLPAEPDELARLYYNEQTGSLP